MSAIAGLLLILYGAASIYIGMRELMHPNLLTHTVAYSTAGIGAGLALVGLGHFVAPHKSFLLAVPMLLYFNVQSYIDVIFYFEKPQWPFHATLLVVSALTLFLSYKGYKAKAAAAVSTS
jgi:hypothetical protein